MYYDPAWRLFEVARRQAEKSTCSYRLGAVAVKKKIIGRGVNTLKTHPIMQRYDNSRLKGIHAELSACLNSSTDLSGSTLYVCRLLKNGEYAMAKPCDTCQSILDEYGIRTVYYTISNEEYGILR